MSICWNWFQDPNSLRRSFGYLLLGLLLVPTSRALAAANQHPTQPSTNTLLAIYFLALDSDLAIYEQTLLNHIQAGTQERYDRMALVVIDGNGAHDTRVELIRAGERSPLGGLPNQQGIVHADLDEYDMADGATLGGLLQWARQSYPATQTVVTFVGHGLPAAPVAEVERLWPRQAVGRAGNADGTNIPLPTKYWAHPNYTDNHPKRTIISPKQLGIALAQGTNDGANPISVLDLVHCFGATIEELYEVAPYVLATIGSPSYAYLNPTALQQSLQELPTDLGAVDLAKQLATYHQITEPNHPTIITTVDNRHLQMLRHAWDQVAVALLQRLQQDPTTRERLTAAWRQAGKYDAPLCDDEWRIDETDYLADMGSFARALQVAFPDEPIATAAQQVLAELSAAATPLLHADHPWMRPDQFWDFNNTYAGIALYGNLIPLQQNGQAYLSFQGHFYTSTEPPYRFLQRTDGNDITWADLFTTFWQGQSVQTVACLPALRITSGSQADLGLMLQMPMTVTIQEQLAYTISVHNIGALPAENVTLYPTVPTTATLVALDRQCSVLNGAINCTLGTLAPGTAVTATLVLQLDQVGALSLQADVTSSSQENDLSNNWTVTTVQVQPAADGCLLSPWKPNTIYVATDQVSYQGHIWQAQWWTQNEEPDTTGEWGVWLDRGPCLVQSPTADPTPLPTVPILNSPATKLFLPLAIR